MIQIAKWGENNYAGVNCGIMDQFACMMGIQDHAIFLNCMSLDHSYFPIDLENHSILLCDTKVKHMLASSEYNQRREECEEGLMLIKQKFHEISTFQEVSHHNLYECRQSLSKTIFKRCLYVIEENKRVKNATKDLLKANLYQFGQKMFETHEGLTNLFDVSCAELDFLVAEAKAFKQILGARMMGGGFGGCTINIVQNNFKETFLNSVTDNYFKKFGIEMEWHDVTISDGCSVVHKPTNYLPS
jgi:galactokinase